MNKAFKNNHTRTIGTQTKMDRKKTNLKRIMRIAWYMYRGKNLPFGEALHHAWILYKNRELIGFMYSPTSERVPGVSTQVKQMSIIV